MAIMTGPEICKLVAAGPKGLPRIVIEPFDPKFAGPNSYDLHLGDTLVVYDLPPGEAIDPERPPTTKAVDVGADGRWRLEPGRLYLGSTAERTETYGLVPMLHGRSSWARYGLFVHVTAGFGDDGFSGHWTLELVATQDILVRPGCKICQIAYHAVQGEARGYAGRYQGQPGVPVASRFHVADGSLSQQVSE